MEHTDVVSRPTRTRLLRHAAGRSPITIKYRQCPAFFFSAGLLVSEGMQMAAANKLLRRPYKMSDGCESCAAPPRQNPMADPSHRRFCHLGLQLSWRVGTCSRPWNLHMHTSACIRMHIARMGRDERCIHETRPVHYLVPYNTADG